MTDTTIQINQLMQQSGVGFGTSGARGTVAAMTDEVCYAYTRAFLQAMQSKQLIDAKSVVIAGDLRPSTPRIMASVARACIDAGFEVINGGFLPSPAVVCYAMAKGLPSIMVTGSHIPDDRNGIKFNRPDGEILKDDEALIRAQSVSMPPNSTSSPELPAIDEQVRSHYLQRYTAFFPADALKGMRVGVYQHSGVARDILCELLQALGAETLPLARSGQFIPVDTEAIRDEDMQLALQWSSEHQLDAIVSTDGDADRPLIADEKGVWLRGDIVGILCGHYLGIDTLVTPVSSNTAVEASGYFKQVHRTRIGSPYVIERMQQALKEGAASVAGYEANGGFLLASSIHQESQELSALPTRDAVLPILAILQSAHSQHKPISQLLAALPPRYTASDRLKEFPTQLSSDRIAALAASVDDIEAVFGVLCGKVASCDTTDGLRITFENGEIVHLRPSGNAPELRCYNEASSAGRARVLNEACLKILAGWR